MGQMPQVEGRRDPAGLDSNRWPGFWVMTVDKLPDRATATSKLVQPQATADGDGLEAAVGVEFVQDVLDVIAYGADADAEP